MLPAFIRSRHVTAPVLGALALGSLLGPSQALAAKGGTTSSVSSTTSTGGWTFARESSPDRTLVVASDGKLVATYTFGSRSVVLAGPARTFAESTTAATVRTTSWVRLLPALFTGLVDEAWLTSALADRSPDVLTSAMQFVTGAATTYGADGALLSSDASYGPLVDGSRQEGSDWNDYLQVTATYDGTTDAPEPWQAGSLDCSGYVRMVFGRRSGHPMTLSPDGVRLPRRAVQMHTAGPGTLVFDSTTRPTSLSMLLAGDLVLFDASTDDGTLVDHVGIYLGTDSGGAPRFVSSRKTVDGPTMGDVGGRSTLSGTGLYATSLRAARRI
jgi:cell wall-associated NlpC family hydrolase